MGLTLGATQTYAQELGRGSLDGRSQHTGLGRAPLPAPTFEALGGAGSLGMMVNIGWAFVNWDVGPADGSDNVFVPSVSLYYKVTDAVDVNASLLYASGKDTDEELGDTSATLIRLGLGARYWLDTGTRFIPYVGGGIAFAMLDGDTDRTRVDDEVVGARVSVDNVPGGYLEGGASFMLADQLHFTAGLSWDFQFTSDATINGRDEDFSVRVLSLNIGVKWAF